jgi:ATP-dependent exoDNAse (exonuclease V) alpha subunit
MMKEAVKAIAALSGRNVIVAAPSSSAVGILKKDDFSKSDTVQRFMLDELLQEAARGQVLWVDEAGFLSASDMRWLVEFASKNDCRLILSGDTRQHHGVERGDALRVMETNGVVTQAALTEIFRQQIPALRAAVHDLSQGKSAEGFDKLDKFGAIQEIEDNAQRLSAIVRTHLAAVELKRTSCQHRLPRPGHRSATSLVVAPTHAECRAIAEAVRAELKKTGLLAETERVVTRLQNTGLTESQRRDPINYERGQVVEFHRLSKGGFKSGQQWEVLRREAGQVMIGRAGQERLLPLSSAAKFNLCEREKIEVAPGDRIRVSKNFQSAGRRFRNNELLTVTGIEDGKITVEAGEIISRGALHIDQGVCVTSHASQGKTVDQVIVSVPVRSFTHANDAQFYASMSRARHAMYLFTDSKAALREAVCRPSERLSPWELLEGNRREKALVKEALQSPKRRLPIPTMELPTQERGLGYERG